VLDESGSEPVYRLTRDRLALRDRDFLARVWGAEDRLNRSPRTASGGTVRPLGMTLVGLRPDRDLNSGTAGTEKLSTGYLLPFEIISIHLLVVLIGAAYLARAKRRDTGAL
jgi:hypothetical protein